MTVVEEFARHLMGQMRSPHTVRQYTFICNMLLRYLDKPAHEIQAGDLEMFRQHLALEKTYSRASQLQAIGAVKVEIGDGKDAKTEKIDDAWLRKERKRIEDLYTFQINNFGRVILREDRGDFDAAVQKLKKVVERYHEKVREALDAHRESFQENFVAEFLPRWKEDH